MKFKSILNRFQDGKPGRNTSSKNAVSVSADAGVRIAALEKSEITELFQSVLEEKQKDHPLRMSEDR